MNPVVHFEMGYKEKKRMVDFYINAFGWKAQMMSPEMGNYVVVQTTETDDKGKTDTRVILKFHPRVAPIKAGIMPLLKNKPDLVKKAQAVRDLLRPWMNVFYDDAGSIGRRYARQDEAGTPFCVTIDFDTLGEKPELKDTVTVRFRDDGRQERVAIGELLNWLLPKIR